MTVRAIVFTYGFEKSFKKLPPDIQQEAKVAIADLLKEVIPASRRLNQLKSYRNPKIYAIHVTRNHSYKLTFQLDDGVATLRRVATHKEIDRNP